MQLHHSFAKTSIPGRSTQHSVGCDPNQKHSGKLSLTTRRRKKEIQSTFPLQVASHRPAFNERTKSGQQREESALCRHDVVSVAGSQWLVLSLTLGAWCVVASHGFGDDGESSTLWLTCPCWLLCKIQWCNTDVSGSAFYWVFLTYKTLLFFK